MPTPHPAFEAVVSVLVPRSRREEILGDLCERYVSPWQYALDALQAIPAVLFSESMRAAIHRPHSLATSRSFTRGIGLMPFVAGRLAERVASSRMIGGPPFIALVGTLVWFAAASTYARSQPTLEDDGPGDKQLSS